jgi:hypothetical protein
MACEYGPTGGALALDWMTSSMLLSFADSV